MKKNDKWQMIYYEISHVTESDSDTFHLLIMEKNKGNWNSSEFLVYILVSIYLEGIMWAKIFYLQSLGFWDSLRDCG